MRIFQHYNFEVGTKISFQDWPAIVLRFLDERGLHHHQLLYYFSDYETLWFKTKPITACHKAVKENPQLGSVYTKTEKDAKVVYLTNIGTEAGCSEAELLALMPKLYRRYGFVDSILTFTEIDFFHRINSSCSYDAEDVTHLRNLSSGSYIKLIRSCCSKDNTICMVIDITDDDGPLDASVYLNAFINYFPGIKYEAYQTVELSSEERANYASCAGRASSLLMHFCKQEPEQWEPDPPPVDIRASWTPGPTLKRMITQYGYAYHRREYGCYYFYKRDSFGHLIMLELDAEPSSGAFYVRLLYNGLGFSHRIPIAVTYRAGKKEFRNFMQYVFSKVQQLEETILLQVGSVYPPTPSWFVAND